MHGRAHEMQSLEQLWIPRGNLGGVSHAARQDTSRSSFNSAKCEVRMTPKITPEQRKALDDRNGEPILVIDTELQQRFVLIADTDDRVRDLFAESNGDGNWTAEKEARRRDLIDRDIGGSITAEERVELAVLDREGNLHYDKIAPRPIEGAPQ